MKIKANKAIIVLRESTVPQGADDRLAPKAQRAHAEEYCMKSGLEVLDLVLIKESGYKADRPKFQKVVDRIKKMREPIALVVDTIDRLKRGESQPTLDLEELRLEGRVEIHAAWDNKVLHRNSPATDLFAWEVIVAANRLESGKKKDWALEANRMAISLGEYRLFAPLGYLNAGGKSKGMPTRLKPDPKRSELVKQAFELYATGEHSFRTLAEELTLRGLTVPGRRKDGVKQAETPIGSDDVASVLKCRTYTGRFNQTNPDDPEGPPLEIKGTNYEPLISQEVFDKVQAVMRASGTRPVGGVKRHYKFSKMIRCGFCGLTLSSENLAHLFVDKETPGAKEVFYRCSCGKLFGDKDWYFKKFGRDHSGVHIAGRGKMKGKELIACPQRPWKESELEAGIMDALKTIEYDEEVGQQFKEDLVKSFDETVCRTDLELRRRRSELTKLKNLERGLVHKYALEDDAELVKTLKSELAKIRQRIAELEREIKELTETEDIDIDETMETLDLCRHFNDYYQRLDPDGQVRFLKSCFNEIIAYRGEYRQEKPGKVKKVLVVDSKGQEYLEDEDFIDDKADSDDLEDHLAVGGTGKKVKLDKLGFLWSEPFKKLYELQIIRKSDRIMSKSKGIVITIHGVSNDCA